MKKREKYRAQNCYKDSLYSVEDSGIMTGRVRVGVMVRDMAWVGYG